MHWKQHRVAAAAATTALCLHLHAGTAQAAVAKSPDRYSTWMATSIMARRQGIMTGEGGSSETLQAGFTQKALSALVAQYPDSDEARRYIMTSAESVLPFLSDPSKAVTYPMDRLSNGNALLTLSRTPGVAGADRLRAAADSLRASIGGNVRSPDGGLWYYSYPNWSYLDGMYSLAPFYALYAQAVGGDEAALADMYYQMDLLWAHTYKPSAGLLVHGYDQSRTAVWASRETGASPHVWGRSLGWFTMALVDTLDLLPTSARLRGMFQTLVGPLLAAVDADTGAWWQLADLQRQPGNYIESSASAMFAYALLKGARLGYLPDDVADKATAAGLRAQRYLTDTFLVHEPDGTLGYNGTVSVCSLNSTASYEYYVGQPIQYNSVLGSAAYVLASLEAERSAADNNNGNLSTARKRAAPSPRLW